MLPMYLANEPSRLMVIVSSATLFIKLVRCFVCVCIILISPRLECTLISRKPARPDLGEANAPSCKRYRPRPKKVKSAL
ncbi:hypothetical protein GWI33_018528 [Rhynchophorus ferrugineus]|uniref:Uncharacterized protein n=1 Tax=Rhynchophorus ferrugineus TaxID=354439 RepID=A0A834HVT1_RHYFE|nr:hypothetical protein GWI33_018528 [Rhynchophorus ferrugineus]